MFFCFFDKIFLFFVFLLIFPIIHKSNTICEASMKIAGGHSELDQESFVDKVTSAADSGSGPE